MAKITVGVPVYNEERFLSKTLTSIVNQTLKDIEVIITDNASTDQSVKIAERFTADNQNTRLICHKSNIGATQNFISSLQQCKTKYFVWIGGHDIFASDYLALAVNYLDANPNAVLVYPDVTLIDQFDHEMGKDGSNIHTKGLNKIIGSLKVVKNLHSCIAIHGVFRADVLKRVMQYYGQHVDHTWLFATALFGEIHHMPQLGILRREVRHAETGRNQVKRVAQYKMFYGPKWISPSLWMITEHYDVIWTHPKLTLPERCIASFCLLFLIYRFVAFSVAHLGVGDFFRHIKSKLISTH